MMGWVMDCPLSLVGYDRRLTQQGSWRDRARRPVFKVDCVYVDREGMHGISGLRPVEIDRCKPNSIQSCGPRAILRWR